MFCLTDFISYVCITFPMLLTELCCFIEISAFVILNVTFVLKYVSVEDHKVD